jgi:alpha-galactosidase
MKVLSSGAAGVVVLFSIFCVLPAKGDDLKTKAGEYEVRLEGELKEIKAELKAEKIEKGVYVVTLKLTSEVDATPPDVKLVFEQPAKDIQAHWHPAAWYNRIGMYDWQRGDGAGYFSSGTNDAPVFSMFNVNGENRLTFAASELLYPVYMNAGINERTMNFDCWVNIFRIPTKPIKEYQVQMRLDARPVNYYKAIDNVQQWWQKTNGFAATTVPPSARAPLYSTWYSYHQTVNAKELEEELKLAKEIGCEVVITDDGWQTDLDSGNVYYGDWQPGPAKFPDLKAHIKKVQDMGFKYMMWYAVPFVGEKSQAYQKFKNKLLYYVPWAKSWVLDPRYPDVRAHIIATYINSIKEYNLDGFKLDFIDRFNTQDSKDAPFKDGMDYKSVEEAADRLMTDIVTSVKDVRPDVLIEFRQHYIGPLMRKYGNMLRAHDCPYASIENRMKTLDIRTLSGNTAVHSDMFRWNYGEPVEAAALQIENIFFSVPQVSVKLAQIPDSHRKMVKFLLSLWKENRDVLLDGELELNNPEQFYTSVVATNKDKQFIAIYNEVPAIIGDKPRTIVLNATAAKRVILDVPRDLGKREIIVYDCMGNIASRRKVRLARGLLEVGVPAAGIVAIMK